VKHLAYKNGGGSRISSIKQLYLLLDFNNFYDTKGAGRVSEE
jgi:hypothetical protein